jgi:20S proteasome alpha/beta subunit
MTIALGILAEDGVVLCSDSQFTSASKGYRSKVFEWHGDSAAACFAVTGNEVVARMAVQDCQDALSALTKKNRTMSAILRTIRNTVKSVQENYVDKVPAEERDLSRFDLVLSIATHEQALPRLFYTSSGAISEADEYVCVGTGGYLGEYILLRAPVTPQMTVDVALVVAMRALAAAKEHDAACGGSSQFATMRGGAVSGFIPFDVRATEAQILKLERITSGFLFRVGSGTMTDEEFKLASDQFLSDANEVREAIRKSARPFRELFEFIRPHQALF